MTLIVRLKDGSAAYRHEQAEGEEENITLEDRDNGTPTLKVTTDHVQVARYRLDAIEYWTTGEEIDAAITKPDRNL